MRDPQGPRRGAFLFGKKEKQMPETKNVAPATSPAVARATRPYPPSQPDDSGSERKVELKFCECCGGLWLHYHGETEPYCRHCAPAMRQVASGRKKPCCSVKAGQFTAG